MIISTKEKPATRWLRQLRNFGYSQDLRQRPIPVMMIEVTGTREECDIAECLNWPGLASPVFAYNLRDVE